MTNLKFNYPSIPEEADTLKELLSRIDLTTLLNFPNYQGTSEAMDAVKKYLKVDADASEVIQCNSGNHSLNSVLQALRRHHNTIITEPFTYPAFKVNAMNFGYKLAPASFDAEGLTVEGIAEIHASTKARLIYIQPTIHNPTCVVMPEQRRKQIAVFAKANDITILEDDAYRFLHPAPPPSFLELLPENTIHIFSMSKPFNSLVKTCFVVAPKAWAESLTDHVRLNSSGPSTLLSALAVLLLNSGTLETVVARKRALAEERQRLLLPMLDGFSLQTFAQSFHIWMRLPKDVKSTVLSRKLMDQGIVVPAGAEFSVENVVEGEGFIRIALGAEKNEDRLAEGLRRIVENVRQLQPAR